ncbi:MAG: YnbE family lipoprotein [Gammaproteobacteria bacterium]|nr:YnbE family lipoprotein [Gammaproteobacteria bacterium]
MQKIDLIRASIAPLALAMLLACTPTVKVSTDEPITINLNVNIKHEIIVKVDKQLDDLFDEDSEVF